eukprot:SAG11_NODE_24281_length_375_cov_1.786232_1_plen_37_part_10
MGGWSRRPPFPTTHESAGGGDSDGGGHVDALAADAGR